MNNVEMQQTLDGLQYLSESLPLQTLPVEVVASADEGPPDFFVQVQGKSYPLTRVATAQLGRLAGLKRSAYREFMDSPKLIREMVGHSLAKRCGGVVLGRHGNVIVGVWSQEKPFLSPVETFQRLLSYGAEYHWWCLDDGSFECLALDSQVFSGSSVDPSISIRPGVLVRVANKIEISPYVQITDGGGILGTAKAPKASKKRGIDACFDVVLNLQSKVSQETLCSQVYSASATHLTRPADFVSRAGWLHGYSKESLGRLVAEVGQLPQPVYGLQVLSTVAQHASSEELPNRRSQTFAAFCLDKFGSACGACGLPTG